MSAAVAALGATLKKGRIKIILIAAVVLLLLGGGVAYVAMKSAHVEDDEDEAEVPHAQATAKQPQPGNFDPKTAPTFLPLEVFTVNLADRDTDRFAQVGVTLEVEDAKVVEQIKAFMPAIRNNILMLLSSKSAEAVRDEAGKRRLAAEIRAQSLRPLGYDIAAEDLMDEPPAAAADGASASKPRKRKALPAGLPIKSVHFANFIVQ